MKLLITGGVGFIGTNASAYFAALGHQVVVVDNFSRTGVEHNARFLSEHYPEIRIIKAAVLDTKAYVRDLATSDAVLHLAGQTAVTTSISDPLSDFSSNLESSIALLEAIRHENPDCVAIYASTNKVFGDLHDVAIELPEGAEAYVCRDYPDGIDESFPLSFVSPYGCSKGAADQYFLDYARTFGLRTVVFRQSCIFGPHQQGVEDQGWVAHFSAQALKGKTITLFGDGFQVRDLLYVDDLIKAYEAAIERIDAVAGEAFVIGGGVDRSYSLVKLIRELEHLLGDAVDIRYAEERLGDQKYFVASLMKAERLLGWKPTTLVSEGLRKLLSWQQAHLI